MSHETPIQGVLREDWKHSFTLPSTPLRTYSIDEFRTGEPFWSGAFILATNGKPSAALSSWVSPKPTRSYPGARIYDTMKLALPKITTIPVVKDEGDKGDRDYLNWNPLSLMTYLGVYYILGWYSDAKISSRNPNKITEQDFDYDYLAEQVLAVLNSKLQPLQWNREHLKTLPQVARRVVPAYEAIQSKTGVPLHDLKYTAREISYMTGPTQVFKDHSQKKSLRAQKAEFHTHQPKEDSTFTRKAMIDLTDPLGGKYTWTVDELWQLEHDFFLTEMKYGDGVAPKMNDVKEGFLRLIPFNNIVKLSHDEDRIDRHMAALGLTGEAGYGACWNFCPYANECCENGFECRVPGLEKYNQRQPLVQGEKIVREAFAEGRTNGIIVIALGQNADDRTQETVYKIHQDSLNMPKKLS